MSWTQIWDTYKDTELGEEEDRGLGQGQPSSLSYGSGQGLGSHELCPVGGGRHAPWACSGDLLFLS